MLRQVPLGVAAALWLAASPAAVHHNRHSAIVSCIRASEPGERSEISGASDAAQVAPDWAVVRDSRFEIYSQDGEATARKALQWFELLRAAARQETGMEISGRGVVRVIGFSSETDYSRYRMTPTADAYYVGGERDTIVLPSLGDAGFAMAAHEFAHVVQHAAAAHLPPWLSEGLADVFSTVKIDARGYRIGGDAPGRVAVLRTGRWMPLPQLMALPADSPLRAQRDASQMFYAESWALTEMLALSPAYRPRFALFTAALAKGMDGPAAVQSVYSRTIDALQHDLRAWVSGRRPETRMPPAPIPESGPITASSLPAAGIRLMMAEVMLSAGELGSAEAIYRDLARETPENAEVWAGLGALAAARRQFDDARSLWRKALELGLSDAGICFRYAELLDRDAGRQDERRAALQRAVELRPAFDDARWVLALLENNTGHYENAVTQLRAMREVAPARVYMYWATMSDALLELGRAEEAKAAARQASEHASSGEERANAARLAWYAQSHLAVRMTRDAAGHPQMVTTRVPNQASDFNPFIEPADDLQRVEGVLREIQCGPPLRVIVETATGKLTLTIPDPAKIQMRNAPPEFICGAQSPSRVLVEYAVTKEKEAIVRGIEFR